KGSITLANLLRRPGMHTGELVRHGLADPNLPLAVREGAEIDIKYSGYLQRQQQQIDQVKRQGQRRLPTDIDYTKILTLSQEAREKLANIRPLSVAEASHVPGVSKADLNALLIWLELEKRRTLAASGQDR
ncbi:MAG TPA: tRNA uridine-5-carboxymethylaminomethyl(34) synthesis enzyme MnmG, partial [Prochlorococcus sp.]